MSINRKSIILNNLAAMPDFSRAIDLEWCQLTWCSTEKECYNSMSDGVLTDTVPYVIQLNSPCYLVKQLQIANEDDGDWAIWMGPDRDTVAIENRADDVKAGSIAKNIASLAGTNTSSCYYDVVFGKNLFYFGYLSDGTNSDGGMSVFPLSMVNWYYRPVLGSFASSNENWDYHQFLLVPCHGTPSGTLLATKYLFTSENSISYMNTNPVWGTVSGNYCTKTYTYSSTKSVTHTCKAKFYCP